MNVEFFVPFVKPFVSLVLNSNFSTKGTKVFTKGTKKAASKFEPSSLFQ